HKSSVRTQRNGLRTSLVRNPFISPEIIDPKFVINMPVDAIASSRSIYATTPNKSSFIDGSPPGTGQGTTILLLLAHGRQVGTNVFVQLGGHPN
ncbi:MAG: hypothetical protein VB140_07595, partial [Burkholderia sp.]